MRARAARAGFALAAGLTLPLAFAPFGWWPFAVLAPALLLMLLLRWPGGARAAFLPGWCFGLGMFGAGVWWIQVSVHQFGVPYYLFSVTTTALFIAFMALYPALFAVLFAVVRARGGPARALIAAPALWVLVELLRGWLFTGFPWLTLGYGQIDAPLGTYAPLLGVNGVSLTVMAGAAALAGAWCLRAFAAAALVVVVVGAGALFAARVDPTRALDPPLEAALVQGNVPQAIKWDPSARNAAIARYLELSEAHWDADVIVWPETAIAAFPQELPELLAALEERARASGTTLLVGMPTGEPWGGDYFNSLVAIGATPGRYDKRHLVPFGEFFPFKRQLEGIAALLDIPLSDFSAGQPGHDTLTVAGRAAGISICYEDAFGRETIAALPAAALLVNVSNDAWFGDTIAPHQHLEIARMRALETGRWLLRGTNTGITAVIDHRGRVVARAPAFEPAALRARFEARGGATFYARYGDWPVSGLALALLGFSAWRGRGDARSDAARPR
ncbi:MAG: apolipoprotein N-acyltransferase [Gammaproteobacteria bacterium]